MKIHNYVLPKSVSSDFESEEEVTKTKRRRVSKINREIF